MLCKIINMAAPGTIDERAINFKAVKPWEINQNCRYATIHATQALWNRERIVCIELRYKFLFI